MIDPVLHNHQEGHIAVMNDCPKCDQTFWIPGLVRQTAPGADGTMMALNIIATLIITAVIYGVVVMARWIA